MEEEQRSNAEAFASTANTTYADAACSTEEILQGLRHALKSEDDDNIQLSPEMRDELLEESFPKIHPEEGKAKELTMDEFVALRIGLQEVIQSDVKEKMILLQDQLSEYHSVLEDMMAFKSQCERLEQEKQDLATVYRQACQVRDDKIALLEKELARLRNDERRRRSSISSCSSTDTDGASSLNGSDSEGQYVHGHDHPQEDYHDHPQQIPAPALTSRTPRMSDHHHHYYNQVARMKSSSPSSVSNSGSTSSSDDFCVGAMQGPLPFQESSAPVLLEIMNQQGVVDDNSYSSRSSEYMKTKRHRPS
jgi:hypothetical protein